MSDVDDMEAWLRGVLDAVERLAKACGGETWWAEGEDVVRDERGQLAEIGYLGEPGRARTEHIAAHDPAHVLNLVAAHRRILDLWEQMRAEPESWAQVAAGALEDAVRALAAGYADRDGRRDEWVPTDRPTPAG